MLRSRQYLRPAPPQKLTRKMRRGLTRAGRKTHIRATVHAMFSRGKPSKPQRPPLTDAQLLNEAVSALARRSRSESELRRHLQKKLGKPDSASSERIQQVIARMYELGYLSDQKLAASVIEWKQGQLHLGRRRVTEELRKRGLQPALVESSVEEAYAEVDELTLAKSFAEKKRLKPPSDPHDQKQTAKLLRTLQRAGFSLGTCWKVVKSLGSQADLEGFDESASPSD